MPKHLIRAVLASFCVAWQCTACAGLFEPPVDLWTLRLGAKGGACADALHFSWGTLRQFNLIGSHGYRACGLLVVQGVDVTIPADPMQITWADSTGRAHGVALDLVALLRGRIVYGGTLSIELINNRVEVWLAEPDKSKHPEATVWPDKPAVLVYTAGDKQ